MTLLLALIVAQVTYEERVRAVDEAIVAERLRVAAEFESMKAWGWARSEYRKVLRLKPDADVQGKLGGVSSIPVLNDKTVEASRYHAAITRVATAAAAKHVELAKWCRDNGRLEEARRHWEWALRYEPVHAEAITALGLIGSGASARDAIWKEIPWKRPLDQADGGKVVDENSALEAALKVKTLKRKSGELEWEALGISEDHLTRVIQQANRVVDFMRLALGNEKLLPHTKRYVHLVSKQHWDDFIDMFSDGDDARKIHLKTGGGFYNKTRNEAVQRANANDDRHDHLAIRYASQGMLWGYADTWPAHWFAEAVGSTCEILFRGKCEIFGSTAPKGTGAGDFEWKDWKDSSMWDSLVRTAVSRGTDLSMEGVASVQLNAMQLIHAAKSASVVRFLMLRWPMLFRSLARSFADSKATPREQVERGLGFTLEELDEFWRRWIMAQ